jgi:hypothetical protein
LFQSFGDTNIGLVIILVIAVVAGALVMSEISDRRRRSRMQPGTRLKDRRK